MICPHGVVQETHVGGIDQLPDAVVQVSVITHPSELLQDQNSYDHCKFQSIHFLSSS